MERKNLYIETYGCQMNTNDSEVVASILEKEGYTYTEEIEIADVILINTCSIREHAETRVFTRLHDVKKLRSANENLLVGVIGCMAERLRDQLFDNKLLADIVAGPDSYRDLPNLVSIAQKSKNAISVHLSKTETYADIMPYRVGNNSISTFVSIMRGCDNFCTYCIVPYTRGRERSRDLKSILNEVDTAVKSGFKEITLLGQNVNSYLYEEGEEKVTFPNLMEIVAQKFPKTRIRFSTSHPKDIDDELLYVMAKYDNLCKWIHLPVQSGSSSVLKRMDRTYDALWYKGRVDAIKRILPEASITSDFIAGFCGETEEEHQETLEIMRYTRYDLCYMFKYSERPGTIAARKLPDDVPEEVKTRRLNEIIALQRQIAGERNEADIGKVFEVLIEGHSKKNDQEFKGRTSQNKIVIFPKGNTKVGQLAKVKITMANAATLKGELVETNEYTLEV